MRLLFVCMGNICRSPTAEGVMRHLLDEEGLAGRVTVDSAGTGAWHAGEPPDHRAAAAAAARGIALNGTVRQLLAGDFSDWDLLLVMDRTNERELLRRAPSPQARAKVALLRSFVPQAVAAGDLEVPDPYYGGADGFEHVLDVVERACRGLLDDIRTRLS